MTENTSNRTTSPTSSTLRPVILVTSLLAGMSMGSAQEASVLDLFPPSGLTSTAQKTSCSFDYKPAGSTWIEGIEEKQVFLASMQGEGFKLGVGKGGHIYSLRGAYGESVPPQRAISPWNDEVWQAVATSEALIDPIHKYQAKHREAGGDHYKLTKPLMYFIHQAGIYTPGAAEGDSTKNAAFYSPVLRKDWNPETKTLRLVNWMQQANTPCVWKSKVLIYTAYRDLGEGVIEVNQVLHNYGKEELAYFSAPWGGVRKSSTPITIMSKPDGTWAHEDGLWGWKDIPTRDVDKTGGWKAWVKDAKDEQSPGLAFVFGKRSFGLDKGLVEKPANAPLDGKRLILWGSAGTSKIRDYQVAEQSAQLKVKTGQSLSIRWYLVSGTFAKIREQSAKLADKARVVRVAFNDQKTQSLYLENGKINTANQGVRWAGLLAEPAPGSVPVFLLKDKRNGKEVITADLYALAEKEAYPNPLPKEHAEHHRYENRFIYKQYSPHIGYESLLGYAYPQKPARAEVREISAPEGTELHESAKGLWILE